MAPAPDLEGVASRIGPYILDERVGEGGTAVVYRGHDAGHPHQPLAIKIFDPPANRNEALRFFREARVLATLSDPHVPKVYEFGKLRDKRRFLIMEFLEGPTLRERMDAGRLSVAETLATAGQLLTALSAVHRLGVLHRDVKPANVVLCTDGFTKLVDFGIATAVQPREGHARNEPWAGTPPYMAPERFLGEEADARADIYAVGAILYELLTDRTPFVGDTAIELASQALTGTLLPLECFRQDLPSRLTAVVMRALSRARANRYASASDMRRALREVWLEPAAGSDRITRPEDPPPRTRAVGPAAVTHRAGARHRTQNAVTQQG